MSPNRAGVVRITTLGNKWLSFPKSFFQAHFCTPCPSSCLPFPALRMTWEGKFTEKGLYWTEEQRKSGIKSIWMWSH